MTDEYDRSRLIQKPNNWVPERIEYEGNGVAEFYSQEVLVYGKTKIIFEDNSACSIQLYVEKIISKNNDIIGLFQILTHLRSDDGQSKTYELSQNHTVCDKFTVTTDDGIFYAENIESLSWNMKLENNKMHEILGLNPWISSFTVYKPKQAKYWSMPLLNFRSNLKQQDPRLAKHPLRIYPEEDLPNDIPENKIDEAKIISRWNSRLIIFEYQKELGFIECISNYKEQVEALHNKQKPCAITAVMIGCVGDNKIDDHSVQKWYPKYFLLLLSLVSGNNVNAPWLEFRDCYGNLVKRVHGISMISGTLFLKGKNVIDEGFHTGAGDLLTKAQTCPDIEESYLISTIRHVIDGSRESITVEDQLDHLCRAFDTLCEHFGTSQQYLLSKLSDVEKKKITTIINDSIQQVKEIRVCSSQKGDYENSRYLDIIIGRLSNTTNKDRQFGVAVCDLLRKFNLPDADIIDSYFAKNPRQDNATTWAGLLSKYRGRVIHTGFFNFHNNEHDINDVVVVIDHLWDLLSRIVLIILRYEGVYNCSLFPSINGNTTNWVNIETTAKMLGYDNEKNIIPSNTK